MIGKPRGKKGMLPVWVYNPALGRKVYVGQRPTRREASLLEAGKIVEFGEQAPRKHGRDWTVGGWREHWMREHHGENTPRTEITTRAQNEQATNAFISAFAGRKLRSITHEEADRHARWRPHEARTLAAMFEDAKRLGHITTNVWRGLAIDAGAGRSGITPLTEDEIADLERIAVDHGGVHGRAFADFIVCAGWVGWRPGEACGLERTEVDLLAGLAEVHWQRRNDGERYRTKTKQNRTVVLAPHAVDALARRMRATRGPDIFLTVTGRHMRPNSVNYYWRPVRDIFTAQLPEDHWLRRRLRQNLRDVLDPYELRHFCGSYLADQGRTAREISVQLGNSERVCEKVYIHDYEDRVRDRLRASFGSNIRDLRPANGQRKGQREAADAS